MARKPFCAELSAAVDEPLGATASHVDFWILLEHRGRWGRHLLEESELPAEAKAHLRAQLGTTTRSRLLFIRKPERRSAGRTCFISAAGVLRRLELERYEDLAGVDLERAGEPVDHPLLAVCTHGKRDRCCARFGGPLYREVRGRVDADWVWQCSHVGGDRFAGNLVCFPEGLYFGRLGRGDAESVLDEYLGGRIYLDRYRGRSTMPFAAQAAELHLRRVLGFTRIDALELVSQRGRQFRFRDRAGSEHEVEVRTELGEPRCLTCDATEERRPRRYVAVARR